MKLNKLNTTQMDLISPLKMVLKMCTKIITYQPVTSQPHQRPRRVPMHHGARHNSHHRQLTHLIWCILFNHRIQLSIIRQRHRMETLPWRRQYRPVVQVKIQPNRAGSSKCYEKIIIRKTNQWNCVFVRLTVLILVSSNLNMLLTGMKF